MVKKKIMAEIVATNVVASRPGERRPAATPTARANIANTCSARQTHSSSDGVCWLHVCLIDNVANTSESSEGVMLVTCVFNR